MKKPEQSWEERVRALAKTLPEFRPEAFFLIYEVLGYTIRMLGREGHVSGRELLEGLRRFAIENYGYLAKTVLGKIGIHCTEDVGRIVFALVEAELLGKTENDSIEDFTGGYDFDEAFIENFDFTPDSHSERHGGREQKGI